VWTFVNDDVVAELSTTAASTEHGFRPTDSMLWKALLAIARKNTIDPALAMLKELQLKWDGLPRLDTWLHVACGTPNDAYHKAAGLNLLGGMVRRIRNPACKHDESTLFISKQGLEKSGMIEALAPDADWYSAGVLLGEKQTELVLLLAGKAVVEIAEMDSRTAAGDGRKKQMLSRQIDMGRTAYSRAVTKRRRRNIFAITVNEDTPLTDPTGNRRFLPVRLKRAVDMKWVRANRDQLLAEAAVREAAGETFRISKSLWAIAAEHQEKARAKPAWEERLEDELCEEVGPGYVLSGDVQNFVDSFEKRPVPSSLWRAVMDRLKFEPYQARPEPGHKARRFWVRGPYTEETPRLTLSRYDMPPTPSRQPADQPAGGGTGEPTVAASDGQPPMPTRH
jgi:predicted P-loop ATPase